MYLLAKLFGEGLAADYSAKTVQSGRSFPADTSPNFPKQRNSFCSGIRCCPAFKGHEDEMKVIARGTVRTYPIRFAAIKHQETQLLQLASLRTGDEIRTYGAAEWNNTVIQQVFPGEFQAMSNDKQFRSHLLPLADALALPHTIIFWLRHGGMPAFLRGPAASSEMNLFLYSAMLFSPNQRCDLCHILPGCTTVTKAGWHGLFHFASRCTFVVWRESGSRLSRSAIQSHPNVRTLIDVC